MWRRVLRGGGAECKIVKCKIVKFLYKHHRRRQGIALSACGGSSVCMCVGSLSLSHEHLLALVDVDSLDDGSAAEVVALEGVPAGVVGELVEVEAGEACGIEVEGVRLVEGAKDGVADEGDVVDRIFLAIVLHAHFDVVVEVVNPPSVVFASAKAFAATLVTVSGIVNSV